MRTLRTPWKKRLRETVCGGEGDLATAQRDIATDGVAAYKKYFHTDRPLALHSRLESVNVLVSGGVNSAPGINYERAPRYVRANKRMPSVLAYGGQVTTTPCEHPPQSAPRLSIFKNHSFGVWFVFWPLKTKQCPHLSDPYGPGTRVTHEPASTGDPRKAKYLTDNQAHTEAISPGIGKKRVSPLRLEMHGTPAARWNRVARFEVILGQSPASSELLASPTTREIVFAAEPSQTRTRSMSTKQVRQIDTKALWSASLSYCSAKQHARISSRFSHADANLLAGDSWKPVRKPLP
jgi:hypothetical protein